VASLRVQGQQTWQPCNAHVPSLSTAGSSGFDVASARRRAPVCTLVLTGCDTLYDVSVVRLTPNIDSRPAWLIVGIVGAGEEVRACAGMCAREASERVVMPRTMSACVVGWSADDEADLFRLLDEHVALQTIEHTTGAYRYIATHMPEFVILSIARSDTIILRLFRQLQRVGRVCVIVIDDKQITAYHGRGYRWSRAVPRSAQGMLTVIEWGARLLMTAVNETTRRSKT
jgi:hypothetical protein